MKNRAFPRTPGANAGDESKSSPALSRRERRRKPRDVATYNHRMMLPRRK
jgi:hypothetical protein